MHHFKAITGIITLTLAVAFAGVASAQPFDVNASSGLTAKGAPLALRGYDAVSYFDASGPQLGKSMYSTVHGGATYQFVSNANLERFEKSPESYLPQYGGFCAYGASLGAKFDGDPLVWKVVAGKLYLNLNTDIQKNWEKDLQGSIGKANANWPRIRAAAPSTLKPQK